MANISDDRRITPAIRRSIAKAREESARGETIVCKTHEEMQKYFDSLWFTALNTPRLQIRRWRSGRSRIPACLRRQRLFSWYSSRGTLQRQIAFPPSKGLFLVAVRPKYCKWCSQHLKKGEDVKKPHNLPQTRWIKAWRRWGLLSTLTRKSPKPHSTLPLRLQPPCSGLHGASLFARNQIPSSREPSESSH